VSYFAESEKRSLESRIGGLVSAWIGDIDEGPRMGFQDDGKLEQTGEAFAGGVVEEAKWLPASAYR
jgi:hypothetical protein